MNIVELIPYLKNYSEAKVLCASLIPGVEFDLIEIYVKDKLELDSEVVFFDAESIPNELRIEVDGIRYENFFPLYMAQEMVQEYVDRFNDELSNEEIAKRLLNYRQKDA
jgi:hypothetical protein